MISSSAADPRPVVFLSYRRADTEAFADALRIHLETELPSVRVFMDTSDIRNGERWDLAIEEALEKAKVVVALVGPSWATLERTGRPRIRHSDDWVAREVQVGLNRGHLLPVTYTPSGLLETKLPEKASLPDAINGLALLEPFSIRAGHFEHDVKPLVEALRTRLGVRSIVPERSRFLHYLGAAAAVSAVALVVWWYYPRADPPQLSAPSRALHAGEQFGMAALVDFMGSKDSDGVRELANSTCTDAVPHLEALGIDTRHVCANQSNLLVQLPNVEHAMEKRCPAKALLAFKVGRFLGTLQLAAVLAREGEQTAAKLYGSLHSKLAEPTDRFLRLLDVQARVGQLRDPQRSPEQIDEILATLDKVWVGEPRPPCDASDDPAAGFDLGYFAASSLVLQKFGKSVLNDDVLTTLMQQCARKLAAPAHALPGLPEDMTSCRFLEDDKIGFESLDRLGGPVLARHSARTTNAYNLGRALGVLSGFALTKLDEGSYARLSRDVNDSLKAVAFRDEFPAWAELSPDPPTAVRRLVEVVRHTAANRWRNADSARAQHAPSVGEAPSAPPALSTRTEEQSTSAPSSSAPAPDQR